MRYLGSKASTAEQVYSAVSKFITKGSLCDPFGGTGVVSGCFKSKGFEVWTGDTLTFAHYFQIARLGFSALPRFSGLRRRLGIRSPCELVQAIESSPGAAKWFTREFAEKRLFFSRDNARRIEGSWHRIQHWRRQNWISSDETAFLLACLVQSADRVANTAGTYYAYLKSLTRRARHEFTFRLIEPVGGLPVRSFLLDASEVVALRSFDVVYLDPPYNERVYSRYYHLPETLARMEEPGLTGKAGMPERHLPHSLFNRPRQATKALRTLLDRCRAKYVAFHYADRGLIEERDILALLSELGPVTQVELTSLAYTTSPSSRRKRQWLYLVKLE